MMFLLFDNPFCIRDTFQPGGSLGGQESSTADHGFLFTEMSPSAYALTCGRVRTRVTGGGTGAPTHGSI